MLTATLPYFGGKRNLAPVIVRELDGRRNYCEPFAGSLAVLFARPPGGMETANDLWGHATNLARVLASARYGELADRVARTLLHEEIFREAKERCPEDLHGDECAPGVDAVEDRHVEAAYWLLVRSWMGRNGCAGTTGRNANIARRFTANGGDAPTRWRGVAESIPWWHERLRGVSFTRMDAVEMIERLDDDCEWAIYADPPYVQKSVPYVVDPDRGDDAEGWHRRLAAALNAKRRARVVVSYYPHPLLDELYPRDRWTWREIDVSKATACAGGRGERDVRATELLLINGPSVEGGGLW